MDQVAQNPPAGSSSASVNPAHNAPSSAVSSAPSVVSVPDVSDGGSSRLPNVASPAAMPLPPSNNGAGAVGGPMVRTGANGFPMAPGEGVGQAAQPFYPCPAPGSSSVAPPPLLSQPAPTTAALQGVMGQPQNPAVPPQPNRPPQAASQSAAWSVPNPLLSTGVPGRAVAVSTTPQVQQVPQQPTMVQPMAPRPLVMQQHQANVLPRPAAAMQQSSAPPRPIPQQPIAPPRPIPQQSSAPPRPMLQQPRPIPQQSSAPVGVPSRSIPQQSSASGAPVSQVPPQPFIVQSNPGHPQQMKPKVVLSMEAKQALAKAIWSAIRSPDGVIAPDLMRAALATGLPQHAILNAARVAREREALKRNALARQQQQQQQQRHPQVPGQPHLQQQQHHHQQQRALPPQPQKQQPPPKVVPGPVPSSATATKAAAPPPPTKTAPKKAPTTAAPPKPAPEKKQKLTQTQLAQMAQAAKMEERTKWKRVQNGVFLVQKSRFLALPYTLSAMVRSPSTQPALGPTPSQSGRKRPREDIFAEAARLREQLKGLVTVPTITPPKEQEEESLLDPEKFKRIKIEPKKFAKALDRVVRKGRQLTAEALGKQHKELGKAIASHQQEFFKFHRSRRTEAHRIAKSIRDNLDKEVKKKEKDAAAAERARIAALKANDMDAYSKLLEETKNTRLKFLMDKTESHFSQISTSLLQARNKDGSVSNSGGTGSYYASAHHKQEEVRQPGILVGGDLKEYQMSGLQWLVSLYNNKLNGILADEMGLGKTIQAISLVAYLMEIKSNLGPFLVIVPLSTLSNWVNEFNKWCPSAHLVCYKGTPAQRKQLFNDQVRMGHFNVLLTTYEYIIKDKSNLRKITWQYAIVDEGHRMKNSASKFAKTLSTQYTTKYRILLTGTPLMNDLSELWSLLNFLLPSIFNSVDTFDQWFNRPFAQFGTASGTPEDEANALSNEERMFIIHRLHELLRPFMLRRVKSEVLDQLPEKVEKVLKCDLSSWQKELYKQISVKAVTENSVLGTGFVQPQVASRGLNNVVMQLRKVCNHPFLFSPQGYHINEKIIRSSGKMELLDRMLPKLRVAGHRVLMFTQMTAVMTILEDYFAYRGYLSLRLDGSTPAEEREKRMYKFNAPDSPYFVFLLSTRAGGLGLNLTAADTVIIFDSDWNPMMDLQAQDRAHRIGQRSDVSVFRLCTNSPVEEKILGRATEKLNMSELVVEAGKFDRSSVESDNSLERKRLMEVLLTDFDTTANANSQEKATSEVGTSEKDGGEDDDDDDDGSESSEKDELNDLLSNNESDYQLYKEFDMQRKKEAATVDVSLYADPEDIPDWIRYPTGKKDAALEDTAPADGSRKRKEVMYDDGLTEKQFLRMMEKQADGEEAEREDARTARRAAAGAAAAAGGSEVAVAAENGSDLTDWTFRKLISCTKMVIALKDPTTKRRLCEIFLEKPPREQYPDYYELIEKPVAINDILRKCRGKMYTSLQEFREDWNLMLANCKLFNGENSWVTEDGRSLLKELDRVLKKNGLNEDAANVKPKPSPPKKKKLRIKLSLKTLKPKEEAPPPEVVVEAQPEEVEDPNVVKPTGRGRRKKKVKTY